MRQIIAFLFLLLVACTNEQETNVMVQTKQERQPTMYMKTSPIDGDIQDLIAFPILWPEYVPDTHPFQDAKGAEYNNSGSVADNEVFLFYGNEPGQVFSIWEGTFESVIVPDGTPPVAIIDIGGEQVPIYKVREETDSHAGFFATYVFKAGDLWVRMMIPGISEDEVLKIAGSLAPRK